MKPKFLILNFIILSLIVFIQSCDRLNSQICACGVDNPQKDLEWLKDILQRRSVSCTEVYLVRYKNEDYIGVFDCPKGADFGGGYFSCDGIYICGYQGFTGIWDCSEEFTEAVNDQTLIYKQDNP